MTFQPNGSVTGPRKTSMSEQDTWIDEYDNVLEVLFWEPQHIGRQGGSSGKNFDAVRAASHAKEVPLNHLLNYFFRLAPGAMLSRLIGSLAPSLTADHLSLRSPTGFRTHDVCQPDIWLSGRDVNVFIELKVKAALTFDQVQRYVIFAAEVARDPGPIHLVMLSPSGSFPVMAQIDGLRQEGLTEAFAASAVRLDVSREQVRDVIDRLTIHEASFSTLSQALTTALMALGSTEAEESLDKLLFGINYAVLRSSECASTKGRTVPRLARLARHAGRLARRAASAGEWRSATVSASGSINPGYPVLGSAAEAFTREVAAGDWLNPLDWVEWRESDEGRLLTSDAAAIAQASEEQLGQLLTYFVRQDRFVEGALLRAFEQGFMLAVAKRAEQLLARRHRVNG